jgi:tetratricopeptide (TPR) repeat protein
MSLSIAEKIQKALQYKEAGNEFVKQGNWKKALENYHKGHLYVKGLSPASRGKTVMSTSSTAMSGQTATPEEIRQIDEIIVATYTNMALCYIKTDKKDRAIDVCTNALTFDPNNVKALFRRGQVYLAKNNLDKAEEDLKAALAIEPNNASIRQELKKLTNKIAEEEKRQKRIFAGFFDKLSKAEEEEQQQKAAKETEAEADPRDKGKEKVVDT